MTLKFKSLLEKNQKNNSDFISATGLLPEGTTTAGSSILSTAFASFLIRNKYRSLSSNAATASAFIMGASVFIFLTLIIFPSARYLGWYPLICVRLTKACRLVHL